VGQFVQQMNGTLNDQFTVLGQTVQAVTDAQRDTQKNLHNTMAAAQTMSKDAETIQKATAEIAVHMQRLCEELDAEKTQRNNSLLNAEEATQELAVRLSNLNDSLRRMQLAVDVLTAELNGPENGQPDT